MATLAQQGLPPGHEIGRVTSRSERTAGWAAAQHRKPSHFKVTAGPRDPQSAKTKSEQLLGSLETRQTLALVTSGQNAGPL